MTDIAKSRKERSISSWISIGSTFSSVGWVPSGTPYLLGLDNRWRSDVEEAHVLRVLLDEPFARLDVLTHEGGNHLVGDRGVFDRDLQEVPGRRVHRGLAELPPVHLAEALEPAHLELPILVLGLERAQRGFVLQVVTGLADVGAEQRWLRDVDVAAAHDLGELTIEIGEQQRADMAAVDAVSYTHLRAHETDSYLVCR